MTDWRVLLFALSIVAAPTDGAAQQGGGASIWEVDPNPEVTIGQVAGPEEYLLTSVQQGLVLDDGGIVVRNSVRNLFELRYYDSNGRYLATASRYGDGPFEFRTPLGVMHLPGDSVLVLGRGWRYSVFGSRAERVRDGRVDGAVPRGLRYDLIDATHVGMDALVLRTTEGPSGPHRDQWAFLIRDFSGATDTVAIVDAELVYVDHDRQPGVGVGYTGPFSPTALSAAGAGMFWLGGTARSEIHGYDAEGQLVSTIRLASAPTPVSRRDRDRWMDEVSPRGPGRSRGAREMGFPDVLPYWRGLEVDRGGNVWVLRYEMAWAEGPQFWDVFDQRGLPLATVTIPREIAPRCGVYSRTCGGVLDIGVDFLLLSGEGPFDVPQVRKHRIIRD